MTIKKNIGTFRDGSAESMRRSVSTRKFADSVSSEVAGLDSRLSGLESYTAAVRTDWTGSPPTTLSEAIDRIAAALGPIA